MLTPLQWLAASAVIVAGTIVQGSIGFGVALLGAPLLYLIDPALIPAPMIVAGLGVSALVLWRERRAVDGAEIARVLPGIALGVAAAGPVMRVVDADTLGLLFGGLVLLGVGLSVGRPPVPGRRLLFAAGGLSGFMGTTTSIGGPPLALAFQDRSGTRLRGTLSACFAPSALLSLLVLYWAGHLQLPQLIAGLSLVPAMVVGFWVSAWTAHHLDRHWLRAAVLVVSALAALAAIVRALV